MHVVMPIYARSQGTLWDQPASRAALSRSIECVTAAGEIETVLVVSDDRAILALAEKLGAAALFREADDAGEVSRLLPFGARTALAAFREKYPGGDAPVMVTDYRNPLLMPQDIDRAVREFAATGAATLVSVTALKDNPCQLAAYYRLIDSGIVHCFEPTATAEAYLQEAGLKDLPELGAGPLWVTQPFFFDWTERGRSPAERARVFIRVHSADRLLEYYGPAMAEKAGHSLSGRCLWAYEDACTARLVVPGFAERDDPQGRENLPEGFALVGASFREGAALPAFRLFRGAGGGCCLVPDLDVPYSCLSLQPIKRAGLGGAIFKGAQGGGPVCFECGDDVAAFAYGLLEDIGDGAAYDVVLDAPGEGVLWKTDPATGRKTNLQSNEVITGRQGFPEVYAPDVSIGILSATAYAVFDSEVIQGRCYGLVLREDSAVNIRSEFDLLRYLSMATGESPRE